MTDLNKNHLLITQADKINVHQFAEFINSVYNYR